MKFWEKLKDLTQPYSNEDYDDDYEGEEIDGYEEEVQPRSRRVSPFDTAAEPVESEPAPAVTRNTTSGFGGQVLSMGSGKQEVVLFHAKNFEDAAKAADELRKRKAVILNMENVDKGIIRRVVDFLSGSVYALDGRVKKVAQSTYLFCPHNMDVVGDLENLQADAPF